MPQNAFFFFFFFFFYELAILWSAKQRRKNTFFYPPSPLHGNFCNCNNIGSCTASRFWVLNPESRSSTTANIVAVAKVSTVIHSVKQRLFRNRPGSALRPLATSCAKDDKAHSLSQTSFAEWPNNPPQGEHPLSFKRCLGEGVSQ